MTFGSLFAGIGGFDLGLERAGMRCVWQVEIDDYATRVLEKHWPDVPKFCDVREFPPAGGFYADVICGGFPCQDISDAGKRAGIEGARSGLWTEFARVVREVRPRYVIVENVAAMLRRGMGVVLGDLAACGYDAEWEVLAASDVGAPHIRERVFILAYANGWRPHEEHGLSRRETHSHWDGAFRLLPDPGQPGLPTSEQEGIRGAGWRQKGGTTAQCDWWAVEPDVGRVAHGVSHRVDRLRGLGNAVVPQVAEWIGRRIMESQSK